MNSSNPMPTTPSAKNQTIEELKSSLHFSAIQGSKYAVMTTQEAVRGVLFEVEQLDELNKKYFTELESLRHRVALLDWIKANVGNIDFNINVPPEVMSTNPWIAVGHNFETAVATAKEQLALLAPSLANGKEGKT